MKNVFLHTFNKTYAKNQILERNGKYFKKQKVQVWLIIFCTKRDLQVDSNKIFNRSQIVTKIDYFK